MKRPWAQATVQVTVCIEKGCSNRIDQSSGFRREKKVCDECIINKKKKYIKDYLAERRKAENVK